MSDCFPIVVDIETANLGPGKPGQKVNPSDWEIACIGVFDSLSNERYVFIPFDKIYSIIGYNIRSIGILIPG